MLSGQVQLQASLQVELLAANVARVTPLPVTTVHNKLCFPTNLRGHRIHLKVFRSSCAVSRCDFICSSFENPSPQMEQRNGRGFSWTFLQCFCKRCFSLKCLSQKLQKRGRPSTAFTFMGKPARNKWKTVNKAVSISRVYERHFIEATNKHWPC